MSITWLNCKLPFLTEKCITVYIVDIRILSNWVAKSGRAGIADLDRHFENTV